ncbi:2-C-methyl-D-erythritol 4-phosphate cytidylyltransferase [Colwelliaceae bacterium 6471]
MAKLIEPLVVVVPAAGVGKRMQSHRPKQYLSLHNSTILEHTVNRLLAHPSIDKVIIALSSSDEYYQDTSLMNHPKVQTVVGGVERVDSVLAGIQAIDAQQYPWVLVHDAARPCVPLKDISTLITLCHESDQGGLLAAPVRDTMKRTDDKNNVLTTVDRSALWHALTPQMFKVDELRTAIETALHNGIDITDESSAMEYAQLPSQVVEGSSDNIKITRADDLTLAAFILTKQQEAVCE